MKRCMDLLVVVDLEFNFDLLKLGYRVRDGKIARPKPGALLTDANVKFERPAAPANLEVIAAAEVETPIGLGTSADQ